MVLRKNSLQDVYSDYLIVNQGHCHCTSLGAEVGLKHDKLSYMLRSEHLDSKWLWRFGKSLVRSIESADGILVIDDTVEEKAHSRESMYNCPHWDHSKNRLIKGLNQVTALYHNKDISVPVGFRLVTKSEKIIDAKTQKEKRISSVSKQEYFRDLVSDAVNNWLLIKYIVADKWYSSCENMNFIHKKALKFVLPLKNNRKVALSLADKKNGVYQAVSDVKIEKGQVLIVYVEGVEFPLLLQKQVFQTEDDVINDNEQVLYLVSNDLTLDAPSFKAIYSIRWKVECFFKSIKSNLGYAKSPAHTFRTQNNHIVLTMAAFIKLEIVKLKTDMNHFAFKAKLKAVALHAAWKFWQNIKIQYKIPC